MTPTEQHDLLALMRECAQKTARHLEVRWDAGDPQSLGRNLAELLRQFDPQVDRRRPPGLRLSCQQGCDHCCRQNASVTVPELIVLVQHVRGLGADLQAALTAQINRRAASIRQMSKADRFEQRVPCGLLGDGGLCLAYPARPCACRAENSAADPRRCGPEAPRQRDLFEGQANSSGTEASL